MRRPTETLPTKHPRRSIEKALGKLTLLWKKSPKVKLPKAAGAAFDTLDLTLWAVGEIAEEYRLDMELSLRGVPAWALGLPRPGEVQRDVVTLASFGLSYGEGLMLAESREVMALNERYRKKTVKAEKDKRRRKTLEAAFDSVLATNQYRQLLGLRALAWDPRLQVACDQHAEYILESGDFGHFQPDPEFKDFMVRAKRAGYSTMVYENCQRGATKAKDAHVALTRSTEHHRNMVRSDIFEMATGKAVRIWVQNFGQEQGFRKHIHLAPWWTVKSLGQSAASAR